MPTPWQRAREHPTAVTALLVLATGLTAAILDLDPLGGLIMTVGLVAVVPLVYLLYSPRGEEESAGRDATDPVEELRRRYATGEVDEDEFERRLDRLLETEDLEAAGERSPAALRERG